jgi:hypothetical protein
MFAQMVVAVVLASSSSLTPAAGSPEPGAVVVAQNFNACMARCQAKGRPFKACAQICG